MLPLQLVASGGASMKRHFYFVLVPFAAVLLIASPPIQTSTAQTAVEAPKSTMARARPRAPTTPSAGNSAPKVGVVNTQPPCTGAQAGTCGCVVYLCQQQCKPTPKNKYSICMTNCNNRNPC